MGYKFGYYMHGESVLHTLDPRVKIAALTVAGLAVLRADALAAAVITVLVAGAALIARLPATRLLDALKPMKIFFTLIFLLHLFFTEGRPLPLIPLISVEGLWNGLLFTWRFIFLIFSAAILTMTTRPSDLVSGLKWIFRPLKLFSLSSDDLAVMVAMTLRFVPALLQEIDQIKEAQMARGADFKRGSLTEKVKRISLLALPLVRNSILRAEEVAQGMEGRGYCLGESRTCIRELRATAKDFIFIVTLGTVLIFTEIIL
ncbi:MAG: energy-coupling factor transporter transmembrane protein EcfT [Dethiobacter sp.]|jgi:biotin transport system permease protein/energy-coupling factor transport system permease protein|nr:energy-coupling factor transporter transmembrane protein EcfT [Dethiobacter sp.]